MVVRESLGGPLTPFHDDHRIVEVGVEAFPVQEAGDRPSVFLDEVRGIFDRRRDAERLLDECNTEAF